MEKNNSLNIICPYDNDGILTEEGNEYLTIGSNALTFNEFGIVILSGGQGTRLGTNDPKGLYKIRDKELFRYHIDTIKDNMTKYNSNVKLFIMTSDFTHDKVVEWFAKHNFFNLKVEFFKQENSVCKFEDGTPIKYHAKIVESPNGNGNIFKAINKVDIDSLYAINVISVDNILAKILDPICIGAFIKNKLDILSKSVTIKKGESMGIFTRQNDRLVIKEYTETKAEQGAQGNICNHLFRTEFIKTMSNVTLPYHKAHKKIPYTENGHVVVPTKPNGYKLETFIFDSFTYTNKNGVMNVCRDAEFAPLKNGTDKPYDNPKTCEEAYYKFVSSKSK